MASFPCQAFPVQINLSTASHSCEGRILSLSLCLSLHGPASRRWTSHEITFPFLFVAILKLGANWSARSGAPLTTSLAVPRRRKLDFVPRCPARGRRNRAKIDEHRHRKLRGNFFESYPARTSAAHLSCPPSSKRVSLSLSALRSSRFLLHSFPNISKIFKVSLQSLFLSVYIYNFWNRRMAGEKKINFQNSVRMGYLRETRTLEEEEGICIDT